MLARFQDRLVRTLLNPELPAPPAFAVYRNTVMKGCIDALQANYPAVARLVGEEWFRAAAAVYARANPPRVPMLAEYGEGFASFPGVVSSVSRAALSARGRKTRSLLDRGAHRAR
jgi:hypothetical protein